jgi:ATP-dependent DNA ligase
MRQIEPAKCRGKLKESYWDDNNNWVAEFKFDGTRYLMHITHNGSRFTSRRQSVNGTGFVEKRNFPHLETVSFEDTVLDGEMVLNLFGSSYESATITGSGREVAILKQKELGFIHYFCFDILFFRGNDIRGLDYAKRKTILDSVVKRIANPYLHYVKHYHIAKKDYYNSIVRKGGEGIVLKDIHSQYGERSKWVKIKKQETWDVFITGYLDPSQISEKVDGTFSITRYEEKGWIGSICIGQIGLLDCGSVSGMSEEVRASMSADPQKYIGRVIEIEAQERLPSGRFRHPRFIRFRDDKSKGECTYDK